MRIPRVDHKGIEIPERVRVYLAIPCPCGLQYQKKPPSTWVRVGFLFKSRGGHGG